LLPNFIQANYGLTRENQFLQLPCARSHSHCLRTNFEVRHSRCVEPKLQNGRSTVKTQIYFAGHRRTPNALHQLDVFLTVHHELTVY